MRRTLLLLPLVLGACSALPELEQPSPRVTLDGAMVKLFGDARMQSPGSPPVENPAIDLSDLGADDREFGFGGRVSWGDTFGGVELRYFRWHTSSSETPVPGARFGTIRSTASVETESQLDQVRLDWIQPLWVGRRVVGDATVRLGAGLGLSYEEWRFITKEVPPTPAPRADENLRMKPDWGIPLVLGRAEVAFDQVGLRLDLGLMDGHFGDFDGTFVDASATVFYDLQRGVRLMAGAWYHALPATGVEGGLRYDFDAELTGFTFGVRFDV
ncbi:MAG: hypothetical protein R3F30_05570 [Planctomycetota bacterium]